MNLISSRLATSAQTRQIEASLRADAAADAVDRAIGSVWAKAMAILRARPGPKSAQQLTAQVFRQLLPRESIDASLRWMASWGYRATVHGIVGTLSTSYLRAAARGLLLESRAILEDKTKPGKFRNPRPGIIQIALDALGLKTVDLGALLREPVRDEFSAEQQKDIFAALLFPPPERSIIDAIIYATVQGMTWAERLEGATKTSAQPEQLAQIVGNGFARGATPQEIARDLLPIVDGVRSTARRIARTESMRVAHGVQQLAFDGLGDMVVGYKIHATLDQNTRPEHASRNGTVYYAEPKPGQLGYDRMPSPPLEADGSIAWNCRCHVSPVLTPDPAMVNNPALMAQFANAQNMLVPDPVAYSDWFARADERRRRLAVGSRRYSLVAGKVANPDWAQFLTDDGGLMSLAQLQSEGGSARAARVNRVRAVMAQRRELIKQVQTFGFLVN